jgi:hypothetical protein
VVYKRNTYIHLRKGQITPCETSTILIKTYDVIFLSECWMNKDFCFDTDNFVCKSFPRLKSKCIQGGGMFLMIKNTQRDKLFLL